MIRSSTPPPTAPLPRLSKHLLLAGTLLAALPGAAHPQESGEGSPDALEKVLGKAPWREIGPANMGGRTVGIAGIPGEPRTLYMATASGGLWRTTDGAHTWTSIFHEGATLSTGAVAVAPSDPNVVYLGTGENNPRNSASVGDGVWRSTDGGGTWTHLGLEDTERIGRIRVHPQDPDVVWVAAMGHAWGPNEQRGVFRSTDGGATWEKTLYVDENTGAADLSVDPSNPRIVYAALWDYRRRPWHFRSGGPGSGLYRSKDGGVTWEDLSAEDGDRGLPTGTLGRMGVAVAPSDPDIVYAIIENEGDGVLWRSGDGGERWEIVSRDERIISRPFYYADIRIDPTDAGTIWALAGGLFRSEDGGRSWVRVASNIHGDHHALWIDPERPDRVVNGNDGGFHVSYDGGEHWELLNQAPLGQFYHVAVDHRWPYRVCGGLQDNDVWCGPAKTWTVAGGLPGEWYEIQGPGDGMSVAIDPTDPDRIFSTTQAGNVVRVDLATGDARSIRPDPVRSGGAAINDSIRWNWDAPLLLSPHDPRTLYFAGSRVFRSEDDGQSWTALSGDLSRADTAKMGPSGGPITPDNTSAEYHGTVTALAVSPLDPELLWAGTDDGLVHRTRDGGATWEEVGSGLPDLPEERWISHVEPGRDAPGTAFVAVDRHRSDDPRPLLFRTDDFGESWTRLGEGLPSPGWIHVVRVDPVDPDLLWLGTETGVWASWSRGDAWHDLRGAMPRVAVRDLVVHPRDDDLVAGTHGRSIWVLDDLHVVRELPRALSAEGGAHLFPVERAVRFHPWAKRFRFDIGDKIFVAENPPYGAGLSYLLDSQAFARLTEAAESGAEGDGDEGDGEQPDSVTLTFVVRDGEGEAVRTFEVTAREGLNRAAWDLRHDGLPGPGSDLPDDVYTLRVPAPLALPGRYTVELALGPDTLRRPAEVILDPRQEIPESHLAAQRDLLLGLVEVGGEAAATVRAADRAAERLREVAGRLDDFDEAPEGLAGELRTLSDSLEAGRAVLAGGDDPEPGTGAPLLDKLRGLARQVDRANAPPTEAQAEGARSLTAEIGEAGARLRRLLDRIEGLDRRIRQSGLPWVGEG